MTSKARRFSTVVLCIGVFLWCAAPGCNKSAYHDAVVAEHDFKSGVAAFQQAEMIEFQNGRIDAAEHQRLEGGIERIGNAAVVLVASLQSGAANTTVQQNFATVSGAVTDLMNSGVLGIKNPTSQALLKTSLQTAQAILANVSSLLAAPTTTTVPATKTGGL
jgi:hypothetical protein